MSIEARSGINCAICGDDAQGAEEPKTLGGTIAAVYGNLDAEDCARIDREWARMRGYILAQSGLCEPCNALELARLRKENEQLRQDLSHAKAMTEVWMNRARKAEAVPSATENKVELSSDIGNAERQEKVLVI